MRRVDVCICTFRRESLGAAIRSVLAQDLPPGLEPALIVADNDDRPGARDRVADAVAGAPWPVRYLHAPARNISVARNAALAASDAGFLAFLDDDEVAAPGWLAALVARADASGAEVVLGPVEARYAPDAPGWMRAAAIHDTRPVQTRGGIRSGYTCNVLIDRRRPEVRALRFDPALGRSGGEDTDYFAAVHALGGRFAFAPGARVAEEVPPARASFGWLARRRFRMGQTHARVLLAREGRSRLAALPLAAAKLVACGGLALAALPRAARRNPAILRACLHAGVISGLAGGRAAALYGEPEGGAR